MPEYIAHASIDENGKIAGGKAGDQTGKEVCTRTWYNKGWGHVIRIDNEAIRERFANNMIDCANNDCIGYDQNQRNTLLGEAYKVSFDFTKIQTPCECDCSSMVAICLLGAIFTVFGEAAYERAKATLVVGENCATTRTLRNRIKSLTMITATVYTSATYTKSTTYAVYGDIYLKEGSHVVCYIADGHKKGASNDGETRSVSVFEWQKAAILDGFSFPKYGADGEWGKECETVAKNAIVKKRIIGYKYPNLTKIVQKAVGVTEDGKCGKNTREAIIAYQVKNRLYADGCVGIDTWKKILGI